MGRGQVHVTHFKFWGSSDISGMAKDMESSNFVLRRVYQNHL